MRPKSTERRRSGRRGFGPSGGRRGSTSTTTSDGFGRMTTRWNLGSNGCGGFGQRNPPGFRPGRSHGFGLGEPPGLRSGRCPPSEASPHGRGFRPQPGGQATREGRAGLRFCHHRCDRWVTRVSSVKGFGPASGAIAANASVASLCSRQVVQVTRTGASAPARETARLNRAGTSVLERKRPSRRMSSRPFATSGTEEPDPAGKVPDRKAEEPREGGGFGQSSLGVFSRPGQSQPGDNSSRVTVSVGSGPVTRPRNGESATSNDQVSSSALPLMRRSEP